MPSNKNNIREFINKFCFSQIQEAASQYAENDPGRQFDYKNNVAVKAVILDSTLGHTSHTHILIDENRLAFDAVIKCRVKIDDTFQSKNFTAEIKKSLRVSCRAVIEEDLQDFQVVKIAPYIRGAGKKDSLDRGIAYTENLRPINL